MNSQLSINWKLAQELASERDKLDADLTSLQTELRHLSSTVNQKIAAKELVLSKLNRLQEETSKLVTTGEWVLKKPISPTPLSGVATGSNSALISKTLNENVIWNFVKETFVKAWNFFFNRPKKVNPSVTPESPLDSSTKVS
jgi:hypothetical protein